MANKEAISHLEFQISNNQGKLIPYSTGIPRIPFPNGNKRLSTFWIHRKS